MTTYLLSCDHTIERDETPPKFVRCPSCVKGNDGYPKRRTMSIVDTDATAVSDPGVSSLASLMPKTSRRRNRAERQAIDDVPTTAGKRSETWPDGKIAELSDDQVAELEAMTTDQRSYYYSARDSGATHNDAMEAASTNGYTTLPDDVPIVAHVTMTDELVEALQDEVRANGVGVLDEPTIDQPNVAAETDRDAPEISAADLLDGERTAAMIMERYRLAKIEHVAVKTWDGNGEPPATPNLDALKADQAAGIRPEDKLITTSTSTSSKPKRAPKPAPVLDAGSIQFSRNGNPLRGKHNRFSSLAGYCKIPVSGLVDMLHAAGIMEPKTTSWSFTLPSGTKISAAVVEGSEVSD